MTLKFGVAEPTAATIANAAAKLSAFLAAQLAWTPVGVVSQRLMVQGEKGGNESELGPDSKTMMAVQGVSAAVASACLL
ncbi:hypothetical protein DEO72_LG5g2887 [Vigna unguiculata]|uniref:Uncharacterized protein n=1 Tax=Vigna unguiculata TaxID=3917 RepID=A0A4D6M2H4_VIGUN|nr:hypothetical protein DEO72_LG5g2887 [Vigna unguiculata]